MWWGILFSSPCLWHPALPPTRGVVVGWHPGVGAPFRALLLYWRQGHGVERDGCLDRLTCFLPPSFHPSPPSLLPSLLACLGWRASFLPCFFLLGKRTLKYTAARVKGLTAPLSPDVVGGGGWSCLLMHVFCLWLLLLLPPLPPSPPPSLLL